MAEGKFIISAQNKIAEGLNGAKKDLLGFEDAAKSVGDRVKTALTVTAIAAGLVKLGKVAFECFEEFGEGERRIKQLGIALGGNESSLAKATGLIDDMRKISLTSKDDIEGLVSELGSLGKSDADIDKITRAAVNLSNITGKDLNTSFTQINATYAGTTGKLTQLLPQLGNLTKEELAAGGAADIINTKFGELSTALAADNIPQKIKNMKDNWGELREEFGKATEPIFSPIIDGINQVIQKWQDALTSADAYNRIQNAIGYTQKIAALRDAKSGEETLLAQMKAPGTGKKDQLGMSPAQQKMVLDAQQAKIDLLSAQITDAQKMLTDTTKTLLLPGDLVTIDPYKPYDRGGTSGGGGTAPATGKDYFDNSPGNGGGIGWMGQSSIPGPIGAEGMSIFEQVFGSMDAFAESFKNNGTQVFGQSGLAPAGLSAGRSDFTEQLITDLVLPASLEAAEGGALAFGKAYLDGMAKWNMAQETADTLDLMWSEALDQMATDYKAKPGIMGQSGLTPEGFGPRDDFKSQLGVNYRDYGAGGAASFQSNGGGNVQAPTWLDEIGAVFGSLGTTIGPIISEFGSMFTSLSSVMQILNWGKTIVAAFFEVVGPVANELLTPVVGILKVFGAALGDMVVPLLEALSPVIVMLSEAFVWLYNEIIIPVGNFMYAWVATIWNGIVFAVNTLLGWLGVRLEYMDTSLAPLHQITMDDVQSAGESTVSASTSAASANYATQSLTVNIYQQGILIGNDGMTTLARTVRDEIDLLAYAGR